MQMVAGVKALQTTSGEMSGASTFGGPSTDLNLRSNNVPEQIRALVVVLLAGSVVWLLARTPMTEIISSETMTRWRRLWFVTTLAWFLSPSFWVYVLTMSLVLIYIGRRESHVFGLYLLLLTAAPPVSALLPGLGPFTSLFVLDHYRMLALALLLPCAWRLSRQKTTISYFRSSADWLVFIYLSFSSLLVFRSGNIADARAALMLWVDYFLPYYVASRSIQSREDLRYALTGLTLGGVLLSVLSVTEILRGWKLYAGASVAMGLDQFGQFAMRGGMVRPAVTMINSIVLGYAITVALGFFLYLQNCITGKTHRRLAWLALAIGVAACLSRGPWVGAVFMMLVFLMMGPSPIKKLFQLLIGSIVMFWVLSSFPLGQRFISLLPFIGEVEQGNVDYRGSLLTLSYPVIMRNLWLGDRNSSLDAPELQVLKQGEGIIDIVNSYVGVALSSGIVGLVLFLAMFLSSISVVRRAMKSSRKEGDSDGVLLGRSLLVTMLGIMFIIFTVSGILAIPTIYYSVFGICSAFYFISLQRNQQAFDRVGVLSQR